MSLVDPEVIENETQVTQPPAENTAPTEDDVPEKFRGKSVKDVITMYQNAESELGRSRNELGTHRRLIDELIGVRRSLPQPTEQSKPAPEPVTSTRLIEHPEETITQVASRVADDRVAKQETRLATLEAQLQTETLSKKHGNYQDTLLSPEFQDWAKSSPFRIRLIERAASGDFDASDEVLSLYTEYATARKTPEAANTGAQPKDKNLESARQAATVKSGGSSVNKVPANSSQKKTYSRRELARMYMDSPSAYAELADSGEIAAAYEEKRITP